MNRSLVTSINSSWAAIVPPEGGARDFTLAFLRELEKQLVNPLYVFDAKLEIENIAKEFTGFSEEKRWELFDQRLVCFVLETGAEILYTGGLAPVSAYSLRLLKRAGVFFVHHFCEDFRRATYYKQIVASYDLILTLQKEPLLKEIQNAGSTGFYLPNGAPELYFPTEVSRRGVSFVGIPTPWRIYCLEMLHREGVPLTLAGQGWSEVAGDLSAVVVDGNWVGAQRRQEIFSQSLVSLNLSVDEPGESDLYQQISPRLFEIPLCGAIPVSQNAPLLKELIPEVPQFESLNQLLELIRLLLHSPQSPALIQHLQNEIRSHHMLKHRVRLLLEKIDQMKFHFSTSDRSC